MILVGHVLDRLRELADESVHCVVTSPPYLGFRDYGIEPQVWGGDPGCGHEYGDEISRQKGGAGENKGLHNADAYRQARDTDAQKIKQGAFCRHCNAWRGSLGLEPTLHLYLDHMVEICREIRRVLRADGTFWLNLGDAYAGSWGAQSREYAGKHANNPSALSANQIKHHPQRGSHTGCIRAAGLKPKDLMLIPARLAIRLQDDGWWVRSDIAWCKKTPMPESVTDRPTTAWEHVFVLTKAVRYFYDAEAVKEHSEAIENGSGHVSPNRDPHSKDYHGGRTERMNVYRPNKRNMRNFWLLGPSAFPEAHFATFVPEIARRAILAGTSARGVCPKCGAPWARVTESSQKLLPATNNSTRRDVGGIHGWDHAKWPRTTKETETIGWRPTCDCGCDTITPSVILDPFLGAGTTGLVAEQLQRRWIGIELKPAYADMARQRIRRDAPLLTQLAAE